MDETTLGALKRALKAIDDNDNGAVPGKVIAPLIEIARPGLRLTLDMDASRELGAPLVAISETKSDTRLFETLTTRQRQVAELIIEGLPNKTIASRLGISVATVKDHVHAILDRLELPSRAALMAATRR